LYFSLSTTTIHQGAPSLLTICLLSSLFMPQTFFTASNSTHLVHPLSKRRHNYLSCYPCTRQHWQSRLCIVWPLPFQIELCQTFRTVGKLFSLDVEYI
jgi:hypothetical protein